MDAKELQTGEESEKWVKNLLSGIVDELNKERNLGDRVKLLLQQLNRR